MDAEIRTHQALQEAKPSECPKGNRDNKSEVYFKNRFFQQTEFIYLGLSKNQYIFEMGLGIGIENLLYFYKYRLFLQSVYISIITENLTQFNPFVYIAQITILKVGNNSLSFSDKKLSNHLIMREKFCIIEK